MAVSDAGLFKPNTGTSPSASETVGVVEVNSSTWRDFLCQMDHPTSSHYNSIGILFFPIFLLNIGAVFFSHCIGWSPWLIVVETFTGLIVNNSSYHVYCASPTKRPHALSIACTVAHRIPTVHMTVRTLYAAVWCQTVVSHYILGLLKDPLPNITREGTYHEKPEYEIAY